MVYEWVALQATPWPFRILPKCFHQIMELICFICTERGASKNNCSEWSKNNQRVLSTFKLIAKVGVLYMWKSFLIFRRLSSFASRIAHESCFFPFLCSIFWTVAISSLSYALLINFAYRSRLHMHVSNVHLKVGKIEGQKYLIHLFKKKKIVQYHVWILCYMWLRFCKTLGQHFFVRNI